ncbi:hypothetical protein K438DRAFT_1767558 [Mycena galopus ATCC 62051]|nr:hypothetical protein K438DRAFT_1767558 [Mycena galopus ATCC 62051]
MCDTTTEDKGIVQSGGKQGGVKRSRKTVGGKAQGRSRPPLVRRALRARWNPGVWGAISTSRSRSTGGRGCERRPAAAHRGDEAGVGALHLRRTPVIIHVGFLAPDRNRLRAEAGDGGEVIHTSIEVWVVLQKPPASWSLKHVEPSLEAVQSMRPAGQQSLLGSLSQRVSPEVKSEGQKKGVRLVLRGRVRVRDGTVRTSYGDAHAAVCAERAWSSFRVVPQIARAAIRPTGSKRYCWAGRMSFLMRQRSRRGDEGRKRCATGKRVSAVREIIGVRAGVFLLAKMGVCARTMADEDVQKNERLSPRSTKERKDN